MTLKEHMKGACSILFTFICTLYLFDDTRHTYLEMGTCDQFPSQDSSNMQQSAGPDRWGTLPLRPLHQLTSTQSENLTALRVMIGHAEKYMLQVVHKFCLQETKLNCKLYSNFKSEYVELTHLSQLKVANK